MIAIVALVAFGVGVLVAYLATGDLRSEAGELTAERDSLQDDVTALNTELDSVRSDLGAAEATVAACQQAVEIARELQPLFEEGAVLEELWWETEEGSSEEAEIEAQQAELGFAMVQGFGRLANQAEACMDTEEGASS